MKKFVTMMVLALVAVSASAAQIKWGTTGQMYSGDTKMTTANGYTTTAYLVYLAAGSWDSFDVASFVEAPAGVVAGKTANAMGTISATSGNYSFAVGDTITGSTDKITDGVSTFGIIFLSSGTGFGDDKVHYYQSDVYTFNTSSENYNAGLETYTMQPTLSAGTTWTAVPEPASAMLALAGVAMLIRRRK